MRAVPPNHVLLRTAAGRSQLQSARHPDAVVELGLLICKRTEEVNLNAEIVGKPLIARGARRLRRFAVDGEKGAGVFPSPCSMRTLKRPEGRAPVALVPHFCFGVRVQPSSFLTP